MPKKSLSTSDLARAVGVHPSTVRRYVDSGLIPPVARSANGYRRFTPHHLNCLRVACLIYRNTYAGRGIRTSARHVLTHALVGDWDNALKQSVAHLAFVQAEREQAYAAAAAIEAWQATPPPITNTPPRLIGDVAKMLGVSIDVLRNWEGNGFISVPRRATNGYRLYGVVELQRLRVIRALVQAGYSQMAILRMLLQLDKGDLTDVRHALDTPHPDEDVYIAADRWLSTLAEQEQIAHRLIALVKGIRA